MRNEILQRRWTRDGPGGKFERTFLSPDFRVESADPTSAHVRSAQLLITLSKNISIKDVSRGYRIPMDWISLLDSKIGLSNFVEFSIWRISREDRSFPLML